MRDGSCFCSERWSFLCSIPTAPANGRGSKRCLLSGKTGFYKAPKTVRLADGTERKVEKLPPEEIGRHLSGVEPEEVSWLWPAWLALGKLALVEGDPRAQ